MDGAERERYRLEVHRDQYSTIMGARDLDDSSSVEVTDLMLYGYGPFRIRPSLLRSRWVLPRFHAGRLPGNLRDRPTRLTGRVAGHYSTAGASNGSLALRSSRFMTPRSPSLVVGLLGS